MKYKVVDSNGVTVGEFVSSADQSSYPFCRDFVDWDFVNAHVHGWRAIPVKPSPKEAGYTYEQYTALYESLGGVTTHFSPIVGMKLWHKTLLSHQEFETKLARLNEINSHDEKWLLENHPTDYIDVFERELWEGHGLRSDLFIIELERYEKIQEAMKEATE